MGWNTNHCATHRWNMLTSGWRRMSRIGRTSRVEERSEHAGRRTRWTFGECVLDWPFIEALSLLAGRLTGRPAEFGGERGAMGAGGLAS